MQLFFPHPVHHPVNHPVIILSVFLGFGTGTVSSCVFLLLCVGYFLFVVSCGSRYHGCLYYVWPSSCHHPVVIVASLLKIASSFYHPVHFWLPILTLNIFWVFEFVFIKISNHPVHRRPDRMIILSAEKRPACVCGNLATSVCQLSALRI